jgi:myxalamid-type polyketide synthase MxaB
MQEKIAIIGYSGKFPKADDCQQYWHNLMNSIDCISDISADRFNADSYYSSDLSQPGTMYVKKAGLIHNISLFDREFFSITPKKADTMDPQQRILLEVAWEAIEHANLPKQVLSQKKTGVFIGSYNSDYNRLVLGNILNINSFTGTGVGNAIIANRLSYHLNLTGPSMVIDTACSSSLVALHVAVSSLQTLETDIALCGGVNLIITPDGFISACKARMLSINNQCKVFDAAADGYVRSEGCGVVVLKRLNDALSAKDRICAVISATAVNQNGLSNGITAPSVKAQANVIATALNKANLSPHEIDYIETHGTGTSLGDPIEIKAIQQVFGQSTIRANPLILGAVKSNIGHPEAAAGIAGLIKVIMSMENQRIPPNLHFQKLNPHITRDDKKLPLLFPTSIQGWPLQKKKKRYAGISSFGFGGANAHIILEEPPYMKRAAETKQSHYLFTLSAQNEKALDALVKKYSNYLEENETLFLGDIAYSTLVGRTHFDYRLAVIAKNRKELLYCLEKNIYYRNKINRYTLPTISFQSSLINMNQILEKLKKQLNIEEKFSESYGAWKSLLHSLGKLYVYGVDINWQEFLSTYNIYHDKVILPAYPFQREKYWLRVNTEQND